MEKTNQGELLDYLKGIERAWITPKEIHELIQRDKDVSYVCISRKLERLYHWKLLERKKDERLKNGYLYRLLG